MNDVRCPQCGGSAPPNAAFCGMCGAAITAQQPPQPPPPPPVDTAPSQGWQTLPNQPPPNPSLPPPVYYPLQGPGPKVMGDNSKWALGLGIASLFCCGPITGIIGLILAKKDMDDIAAGRAPHLDEGWAKGTFYLNIIALVLFVFGLCVFWGGASRFRHF